MGFAGQVFAAKMAVGLAVPSSGALSRTGSMLAKGAAGIYSSLNQQRKTEAQKRVGEAQAEVDKLSKIASDGAAVQARVIAAEATEGMYRIEKAGGTAMSMLNKTSEGAFGGMKDALGKEGEKLFAGVNKGLTPLHKMVKLTRNFSNMTKAEQGAAIKNSKEYVIAKKKAVTTDKASLAAKIEEREELTKGWKRITKGRQKQLDSIDKEITKKKQNLEINRKLREEAIAEAEVLRTVSVQANNAERISTEKQTKADKELKKAVGELDKAQKDLDTTTDDLTESSKNFGAAVVDTANEMKNNFSSVLVETIATLTAFYYKLNQNTEALMEFERELINANSVWQETDEVLFAAGEQVTQFGQVFGMNMQNGATGLYQLASAGLTANESMEVLGNTLKLSMAVQGDHNTIAKLTTQTLRGFDMEMSESAEVTDKFAHAIQKSLIEYEDLSSAVKFALPFFTSTGQSIDQLLGSLQILTNRALEAGIAGRGLRQALAQFAKHAENNDAAFKKMGISVLDAEGNMRQLNEIAADFAEVVGEDTVNNTELLTSLIDDLNVRGATAFVHLVQASDEFTEAVEETASAGGELDKMVEKQNESLTAQVQLLKNNVQAIFQMNDAAYEGTGYMNGFHEAVSLMIADLQGLIVAGEEGSMELTDFGLTIREIAVTGMEALHEVIMEAIPVIQEFSKQGFMNVEMIRLYTLPLRLVVDLFDIIGPQWTKAIVSMYIWNKILPITTAFEIARNIVMMYYLKLIKDSVVAQGVRIGATNADTASTWSLTAAISSSSIAVWYQNFSLKASAIAFYENMTAIWANITSLTWWQTTLWSGITAMGRFLWGVGANIVAAIGWTGTNYALALSFIAANAAMLAGYGIIILAVVWIAKFIWNMGILQGAWEAFTEPGGVLYRMTEGFKHWMHVLGAIWDLIKFIGGGLQNVISLGKQLKDAVVSPFKAISDGLSGGMFGVATGGYVTPMATGGSASHNGAYLVGERGPEMFQPNQSGQVLNNTATNHIMSQSADRGFSNAGGGMVVSNLTVESAEMNQSNLNIDSFAGNPAMKRRAV